MNTHLLDYAGRMKTTRIVAMILVAVGLVLAACNSSGLAEKPRAKFAHLACLDVNADGRINSADADHVDDLPDFNADGDRNAEDAAFVEGVDIPLAPGAQEVCEDDRDKQPEYLVAHEFFSDADVSCGPGDEAMLVLGVAGGVDDLKDDDQAAGVRDIVNAIIRRVEGQEMQTIGVIAGAALYGAEEAHGGMETWLTNAVRVYLDRFPCLRVTTVGFSHGGVTVTVVAARLEADGLADRIAATVLLDRIEDYYFGDVTSMPTDSGLINVYQSNTPGGRPLDGANVLNFDASGEAAPGDGQNGGEPARVTHVTIDNSKPVREWIAAVVLARATGGSVAAD